MTNTNVIMHPLISEKALLQADRGTYVFRVEQKATKNEVKKAIQKIYNVSVISVNITKRPAKLRRFRGLRGRIGGYKKAVVTLKEGQKIDVE